MAGRCIRPLSSYDTRQTRLDVFICSGEPSNVVVHIARSLRSMAQQAGSMSWRSSYGTTCLHSLDSPPSSRLQRRLKADPPPAIAPACLLPLTNRNQEDMQERLRAARRIVEARTAARGWQHDAAKPKSPEPIEKSTEDQKETLSRAGCGQE